MWMPAGEIVETIIYSPPPILSDGIYNMKFCKTLQKQTKTDIAVNGWDLWAELCEEPFGKPITIIDQCQ